MAKSVRSKWKKRMAKAKTEAAKPAMMQRLTNLNTKLHLVQQNKISSVPMQDPNPNYHFNHPDVDPTKPLKLSQFSTNVRKGLRGYEGNADGSAEIRSAKKTQAQYHPLASQLKAVDDAAQRLVDDGFMKANDKNDDNAVVSMIQGGFDNSNDDEQQQEKATNRIPSAADVKKTSARKMKATEGSSTGGNKTRLVAGGKKQAQYKK